MEILYKDIIESRETIKQFRCGVNLSANNILKIKDKEFDLENTDCICVNGKIYLEIKDFQNFQNESIMQEIRNDIYEVLEKCIKYKTGLKVTFTYKYGTTQLELNAVE